MNFSINISRVFLLGQLVSLKCVAGVSLEGRDLAAWVWGATLGKAAGSSSIHFAEIHLVSWFCLVATSFFGRTMWLVES